MIYGVHMGQGVSANLKEHTLITGHQTRENKLQSCSAVIFVNTTTWEAGLYHFPEGSINEDKTSRNILQRMKVNVDPNWIYLRHGSVTSMLGTMPGFSLMPQADGPNNVLAHRGQLTSFLETLCGNVSIDEQTLTTGGIVSITSNGGQLEFDRWELDADDVGHKPDGNYGEYTVYNTVR